MKIFCLIVSFLLSNNLFAEAPLSKKELAQKLSNPISSLISVPVDFNYDSNIGPKDDGTSSSITIKPVIPIKINEDWNLISRTIVALSSTHNIVPNSGTVNGMSDISQSFYFSPDKPTENGWIWGVGPTLLIPSASDDLLGSEKWAAGPTGVILKQEGHWTYGVLASQTWSFSGDDDREDINSIYFDIWLAYSTDNGYTYSIEIEPAYDWNVNDGGVSTNILLTKITTIGDQLVSLGGGFKYWPNSTTNGPENFGAILQITFLFPQ